MKTFTLDEAQSLLPVLESLLKRAIEVRDSAQSVESSLNGLAQRIFLSGGMRGRLRQRREAARGNGRAFQTSPREYC
jgi:hypothetical protein